LAKHKEKYQIKALIIGNDVLFDLGVSINAKGGIVGNMFSLIGIEKAKEMKKIRKYNYIIKYVVIGGK